MVLTSRETDGLIPRQERAASQSLLRAIWLCIGTASLLLVAAIVDGTSGTFAILLLVVWNGLLLSFAIQRGSYLSSDLGYLNPCTVLFGFLFITYVARPLYNLSTDQVGSPTVGYFSIDQVGYLKGYFVISCALTLFVAGFYLVPLGGWRNHDRFSRDTTRNNANLRLFVIAAISVSALAPVLIKIIHSPHGALAALTIRQITTSGSASLIYISAAYKVAFLLYYASHLENHKQMRRPAFLAWWLPIFAIDLVLGDRAALTVGDILIFGLLAIVGHQSKKPNRVHKRGRSLRVLTLVVVAIFLFVAYQVIVRNPETQNSSDDSVGHALVTLPSFVFDGGQAAGLDYFLVERTQIPSAVPRRPVGQSFSAIAFASIPSGLLSNKPERSAELLTAAIAPIPFSHGANITFTAAGDLYYTFGDIGVVLGYLLLGMIGGWLVRGPLARGFTFQRAAIAFYLGWLFFPVLRSDLFPLGTLPVELAVLWLVYRLMLAPVVDSQKRSAQLIQ